MENFNINRFFKVINHNKLYIAFILLLFVTIGYFYSFYYVTPMYSSSATIMLIQKDGNNVEGNNSITQADITLNQNLLSTYTKIAKSDKVLEQVIKNLNLNASISDLYKNINVQSINNTEVFKISVNNKNSRLAADITNELTNIFSNEVKSLYSMNNVYIMDKAIVNPIPFNINHTRDIAIFAIVGLINSFVLIILIYLFDTTIKSEQDIEEYANLSVLSTIPVFQNKKMKELIVNEQPKAPIAECFKAFRTNIMFSIQNKALNTILITSGFTGEGKSFVSSNLAVTFAQSGKKVVLVDTDMRKGRLHKIFDIPNDIGLSNCLSKIESDGSSVNINKYIQISGIPNLHIIPSGNIPPNPSELLSSPNMEKFLKALNSQYDIVICDGTPCMLVSDSVILSKIVDTTVIVTANRSTKLNTLLKIKKSIEIVGGNIGGTIINKMQQSSKSYQNEYYYGDHNDTNSNMNFHDVNIDYLLDDMLFIDNDISNEVKQCNNENKVDIMNKCDNYNLNILSDIVYDNTTEIVELKKLCINSIEDTKAFYNDKIRNQNKIIASLENTILDLNNKISKLNINDNSNISNDINNIYNQLISMDSKFSSLEQKTLYNEGLIKNLETYNFNAKNNTKSRVIDVSRLNEKVISIQDYLESKYTPISDLSIHNTDTTEKAPINIIDDLLGNSDSNVSSMNSDINDIESVVDYKKVRNKQKRGLFSFKSKHNEPIYDDDEVTIVSQILA